MAAASDSAQSSVRKRRVDSRQTESAARGEGHGANTDKDAEREKTFVSLQPGSYWLTRIVLLRSVAFIYCEFSWSYCLESHFPFRDEVTFQKHVINPKSKTKF